MRLKIVLNAPSYAQTANIPCEGVFKNMNMNMNMKMKMSMSKMKYRNGHCCSTEAETKEESPPSS
jgi:hypothetical protein